MNNLNYEEVPDMISCKDLEYLTDMFKWNFGDYKCCVDHSNIAKDEKLIDLLDKAGNLFYSNMESILTILENGGCE